MLFQNIPHFVVAFQYPSTLLYRNVWYVCTYLNLSSFILRILGWGFKYFSNKGLSSFSLRPRNQGCCLDPQIDEFLKRLSVVWHLKRVKTEDPLWSTGQEVRLPNGRSTVRIRCSANAFELNDQKPTTPGESCGSSTRLVPLNNCLQLMSQLACLRCKDQDRQPLVGGVWQSFLVRSTPWQ